jgi:hypothetical protein
LVVTAPTEATKCVVPFRPIRIQTDHPIHNAPCEHRSDSKGGSSNTAAMLVSSLCHCIGVVEATGCPAASLAIAWNTSPDCAVWTVMVVGWTSMLATADDPSDGESVDAQPFSATTAKAK